MSVLQTPDQVKAEINKLEENCQRSQSLPKINNVPGVRGGEQGDFTRMRERGKAMPK